MPIETIADAIQLSGPAPAVGASLATSTGDLVEVNDALVFQTADDNIITAGDTTVIGGITYTVSNVSAYYVDATLLDGSVVATKMFSISLTDPAGGGTLDFLANADIEAVGPAADLPLITNLEITGLADSLPQGHALVSLADANDNVTLAPAVSDGYVDGTAGADLIDATYVGDPDGDMVDNNDAVLADPNSPCLTDAGDNDDWIRAGAGDDTVFAGLGNDLVMGGTGNDTLHGNEGDDCLQGEEGNDTLYGGEGGDILDGGTGNDTLSGGQGNDTMSGGDDRDTFIDITAGDVVDGNEYGDDFDVLDLSGSTPAGGSHSVIYDAANPENGTVQYFNADGTDAGSMTFTNIENVICFVAGTRLKTTAGEIAIQDMEVGQMVQTMDHGLQPIRWIGSTKRAAVGNLAPIRIRKGALGNDRDLWVSPQHRMLLSGPQTEMMFGEAEVLATAKSLLNDYSITRVEGGEVEYFHILFDAHEIVYAEGAPSESFHPGEQGFNALDQATRDEILELFPELASGNFKAYGAAARLSLKAHEAETLNIG